MSYKRGISALRGIIPDIIPHTQYISNDAYIKDITGIDTSNPSSCETVGPAIAQALDYDFIWSTFEMPVEGRMTDMGHAEWSAVDQYNTRVSCPFTTTEDVLTFDPVEEYQPSPHATIVEAFRSHLRKARIAYPEAVYPGGRYNTLFSACIRTFGWEMFLTSVPHNEERFDRVLEGFFRLSQIEVEAWLETDIDVYLCHDDIVWTSGAVFHPEWYRRYIFPRYRKLWDPLREKGVTVLYCADGDFTAFIDDIAEAGADGFIFEPTTSLDHIVERYGHDKAIIGNADCRVLQYGTRDDIRAEVTRCIDRGRNCPGYFMAVGNHIPNGIPTENIRYFFEVFESLRSR